MSILWKIDTAYGNNTRINILYIVRLKEMMNNGNSYNNDGLLRSDWFVSDCR